MEKRITEQQLAIYKYIVEYMEENLISPSVREICQGVGLKSTATVHSHLKTLEKKGYITMRATGPRTIRPIGYKIVKEEKCAGAIDETEELHTDTRTDEDTDEIMRED